MYPSKYSIGAIVPTAGLTSTVAASGKSVQVSSSSAVGGYIINPASNVDQGLSQANILYVDPTGPASNGISATTIQLYPGVKFEIPPNSNGVWCNSNSSGHKFTVVQYLTYVAPEYKPIVGPFPPPGPTGIQETIKSYLYQEYSDDDDLQAFVAAYNSMMQDIVDTFNGLNLPIYVKDPISGALLDWVGQGVYGIQRPSLRSGQYKTLGPYNSMMYGESAFMYNGWELLYPNQIAVTNDDIYRRILTWHYSKGDGKYFSIPWLKRRVMRFLMGKNGTHPNIDQHYQISVSFGPNCGATIRFVTGVRNITGGAVYNQPGFIYNAIRYNEIDSIYVPLPSLPNMGDFAEAVNSGVLELPFQFRWDVVVG
ncbi:MAG TPA: hypothetical protein VNZ45_12330 [Bacteroidia bacterium]|jgi:hypothetical protein|nr:hypothetical protein [Bacteroidia bacterium]